MNILVPVDGTEHSLRAVEFLTTRTDLLGTAPKVTIFFSQEPVPQHLISSLDPHSIKDYYSEEAESLFASVRALLGDTKLDIDMRYAVGVAAEEIVKEADKVNADLIVMGIRGHSAMNSFLFGSVSNAVLAHTRRPILMLRDKVPEGTSMLRIGIACDGSEYSDRAVDFVLKNRALFGSDARYDLINAGRSTHTIGLSSMASMMSSSNASADMIKMRGEQFEAVMNSLVPKFEAAGIKAKPVRLDGNPGEVIADYAENRPLDLLVMGSHGYGNLRSALMGSTAQKIAANSSVPLLIIR